MSHIKQRKRGKGFLGKNLVSTQLQGKKKRGHLTRKKKSLKEIDVKWEKREEELCLENELLAPRKTWGLGIGGTAYLHRAKEKGGRLSDSI